MNASGKVDKGDCYDNAVNRQHQTLDIHGGRCVNPFGFPTHGRYTCTCTLLKTVNLFNGLPILALRPRFLQTHESAAWALLRIYRKNHLSQDCFAQRLS